MNSVWFFVLILVTAGVFSTLIVLYRSKWFKDKGRKITAVALLGLLLSSNIVIIMGEPPSGFPSNFFGSRVAGAASIASIENVVAAGIFTMNASTANPNNITAYVACSLSNKNMACAIYNAAEVKIATTTAKTITAGFTGWSTFTVNWTLNASILRPSGVYNLTIWSTLGTGGGTIYGSTSGGSGIKSVAGTDQWGWDNPIGFTTLVDSDGLLSIYCNYTVVGGGWVNRAPTISSPSPASSATGILPLCALNFTVSDLDGNNTLVCIWNNKTGSWVKENQTNSFPANQTYRDLSASFATSYNTKYWWKITAYDGHDNVSTIYNFTTLTDTIAPQITLNFAGNHSDKGGPKYRPPSTSTLLSGANLDGYYTNDSYQKEPFIYINLTVYEVGSGMPTSNAIRLSWYNATTNTWDNSTYFTQKNTNYYEYNKTGIPKGKYSFNIYAVDKAGNVGHSFWNKTGPLGTVIRRYVNLNQTLETVTYRPLYLWNTTYTGLSADVLHHDQGPDGTINDTGLLYFTVPGDAMQDVRCTNNIGAYFDNSSCIQPFILTNIYYHVWWSSQLDSPTRLSAMGWNKTRSSMINAFENSWSSINTTTRHSSVRWSHPYDTWGDFDENFSLETKLLTTSSISFTDNNIYEMIGLEANTTGSYKPMIINNRSITTFIILNIPSNATLDASYNDSDSDGLCDRQELYKYYTNPFVSDTDNDDVSDDIEIDDGTDPNNWTDYSEHITDIIRNNGVDYMVWLGENTTAYWVNDSITGMNEATESISIWNRTGWSTTTGLWQTYNGTRTGVNWTVHTFDIIRTYLDDAAGNQTITMTENPDMDYDGSHAIPLHYNTLNKGYNFSAYNRVAPTTLSAINQSIGLFDGDMVARWNRTIFAWDIFICYFGPDDYAVSQWDVIQIKSRTDLTWNT